MNAVSEGPFGILLDIDGVLYVGDEPIEGAHAALGELREAGAGLRLVTNTTSRSRRQVCEHLAELGFEITVEEVLTPAAMAVSYCDERGYESVELIVSDGLREDLARFEDSGGAESVDAVILGDVGKRFDAELLNHAFRLIMDGAELVALQHNRYWRRADGLALDVGAYSAALEYATRQEAVVVGKPAEAFFQAAIVDMGLDNAVMVGDDVEADVGGAMAAGLPGILVRTGKYRQDALPPEVTPTAIADSIADVPALLARILPG
ncbi:MAG TPA: TIGR01458 family HAD-type hydrolase [Solirubrobacteraceae bacterium]|nr:TIGR01458 family HAD-type hydrolase [Solirubrobacteraceae bacterium]